VKIIKKKTLITKDLYLSEFYDRDSGTIIESYFIFRSDEDPSFLESLGSGCGSEVYMSSANCSLSASKLLKSSLSCKYELHPDRDIDFKITLPSGTTKAVSVPLSTFEEKISNEMEIKLTRLLSAVSSDKIDSELSREIIEKIHSLASAKASDDKERIINQMDSFIEDREKTYKVFIAIFQSVGLMSVDRVKAIIEESINVIKLKHKLIGEFDILSELQVLVRSSTP